MGFINLILNLLRMIFGGSKSAPSEEAKAAAGQAAAQTNYASEAITNAEIQTAAAARADADAQRVRNDPHAGDVDTDPAAPINLSPDAHFRD